MTSSVICEYSNQWTITELKKFQDFKAAPAFTPVPHHDLKFKFEYHYKVIIHPNSKSNDLSLFRLKFVKEQGSVISSTLQMKLDVNVNYSDGSLFKKYETVTIGNVQQMTVEYFDDVISETHNVTTSDSSPTAHGVKMESNTLIIRCSLKIRADSPKSLLMDRADPDLPYYMKNFTWVLKSMYDSSLLSDVEFVIVERTLSAHKAVLAAHSTVFMSHFKEAKTNRITITDTTYEVFNSFLKYLYTSEIDDLSWSRVRGLYVLANKYNVYTLKLMCQHIISSFLSVDLVCEILGLAYKYQDSQLKEKAMQYVRTNSIYLMHQKKEWIELCRSYPHIERDIVKRAP